MGKFNPVQTLQSPNPAHPKQAPPRVHHCRTLLLYKRTQRLASSAKILSPEQRKTPAASMAKPQLLLCLLVAAAALLLVASAKKAADVSELQIGVKFKPESCSISAHKGDRVKVHYRGKLTDGTVFDSSYERGDPIEFELGTGQVIKGWDQGILGMCVGEKRKLKIPSKLGYGESGSPPTIPGGATLIFDTELVAVNGEPASKSDEGDVGSEL
uniref:Uncharacterized protein n=1 Tax=Avena sativa TaxID=4498 RepID=A0ACD5XXG5_AVESA